MYGELQNQSVIITGAASGIGLAQVEIFLREGASVVAVDVDGIGLKELEKRLSSKLLITIIGDVTTNETIKKVVTTCLMHFGKIDIVCNTAGILDEYRNVENTSLELWKHIMDTNLTSQFMMLKEVLPEMLENKHGVFVNMASIAGLVAGGGGIAYTSSKHAIIGMTKQLDLDYASQGIRANCIAPGAIETPMNAADFADGGKIANLVAEQTPARRWAKPSEVAELALFLASEKADYIHGAVVPIDGGWIEK